MVVDTRASQQIEFAVPSASGSGEVRIRGYSLRYGFAAGSESGAAIKYVADPKSLFATERQLAAFESHLIRQLASTADPPTILRVVDEATRAPAVATDLRAGGNFIVKVPVKGPGGATTTVDVLIGLQASTDGLTLGKVNTWFLDGTNFNGSNKALPSTGVAADDPLILPDP